MWIIKSHDGTRQRVIAAASKDFADKIVAMLREFSHPAEVYLVAEHYDPITATKFVLDPETNEPLKLPKDYARRLLIEGYVELQPLGSTLAMRI